MKFARLPAAGRFAGPVWLVSALLIAGLAATIAWWATQLLAPRAVIAPAADARSTPLDVGSVGRLFGLPGPAGSTGTLSMPASSIVVLGLVTGERGAAVLAIDGQAGKPFLVGGRLPGGETLLEVRADGVVLDRAGMRVTLPTPPPRDLSILTAGRQASASTAPPVAGVPAGIPPGAPPGAIPGVPPPPPGMAPPPAGPGVVVPQPATGMIGAPPGTSPTGAVPPVPPESTDGSALSAR